MPKSLVWWVPPPLTSNKVIPHLQLLPLSIHRETSLREPCLTSAHSWEQVNTSALLTRLLRQQHPPRHQTRDPNFSPGCLRVARATAPPRMEPLQRSPKSAFPPIRQRMKQIPHTRSRDPPQGRRNRQGRRLVCAFTSGADNGAGTNYCFNFN